MDYLYIVNAFKQQQQEFLLHQYQLQQNHSSTTNPLSIQEKLDNSNMSNSLIWQPWRDLQQAAVHHHLYCQKQQQHRLKKETRLTTKELPTTTWRRERRLRTGEYNHHVQPHHSSPGSLTESGRPSSPCPPPLQPVHAPLSPLSSTYTSSNPNAHLNANNHQISIMMAAAAAAGMRPLCESTNRPSPPPSQTISSLTGQIHNLGQIAHTQVLRHVNMIQNDDAPLDMSVGNLKQRNSPPPPYREPLPGSQFVSSLARPSVITQAPPKRDVRDSILVANRENDNRSCESIDEHFRRSLGNDYFALFSKRSPASQSTKTPSPQPQNQQDHLPPAAHNRTSPPVLLSSGASSLPPHSCLIQPENVPLPTYAVNLPQAHHSHAHLIQKPNTALSPAVMVAQIKTIAGSISPPMPLLVRQGNQSQHQQPLALQKTETLSGTLLTSPQSPVKIQSVKMCNTSQTAGSRTVSPSSLSQQQQQPSTVTGNFSHFTSAENSPLSSPRNTSPIINVSVSNPSPNFSAIMRIKTEPGLQNIKSHKTTPPASPTSTTNPNSINNSLNACSSNTSTPPPSSPLTSNWKTLNNTGNTSAEVLASVDDHFAKALGDTWKKLQENKEMRK